MKNQKTYLVIGAILFVIIIAVYFYYRGKRYTPKDVVLPSDTQAPGTDPNFNPGKYTDAIHEDLTSIFSLHDAAPYRTANTLSNSQLIAIYNDWNHRYAADFGSKNIIDAIKGDYTVWNIDWQEAASAFVSRLETLVK